MAATWNNRMVRLANEGEGLSMYDADNMTYTTTASTGSRLTLEQMTDGQDWTYIPSNFLGGFKQMPDMWEMPKVDFPFRNPNYLKALLLFEGE